MNNILIADFIGLTKCFIRDTNGKPYDYNLTDEFNLIKEVETTIESQWCEILQEQDYCRVDDLKFHTDWQWLMKVVEKIESLEDKDTNGSYILESIGFCAKFILDDGTRLFSDNIAETKIDAVYKAVIQFIEWHNLK